MGSIFGGGGGGGDDGAAARKAAEKKDAAARQAADKLSEVDAVASADAELAKQAKKAKNKGTMLGEGDDTFGGGALG
jgi:hypothetical protein